MCADFIGESLLGLPHPALPGVVLAGQQRPGPWPFIVKMVFHAPSPGVEPGTLTGIREAVAVVASHRWAFSKGRRSSQMASRGKLLSSV